MNAWRINEDNLSFGTSFLLGNIYDPEDTVARGLRLGTDNGQLLLHKRVEQGGLSCVGTTKNTHEA
jgi:hypothetical protein